MSVQIEMWHLVTLGQFRVDGLELPDIAGAVIGGQADLGQDGVDAPLF